MGIKVQFSGLDSRVKVDGTSNVYLKGEDGATFTPDVSQDGTLSWTNDKSLENPAPINIKGPAGPIGPKGDTGVQGVQGPQGPRGEKGDKGDKGDPGKDGVNGMNGRDGRDGVNGVSVTHRWEGTTLYVSSASGTTFANLKGETGPQGPQGVQGIQGIRGEKGDQGIQGVQGEPGKDGEDGKDGAQGPIGPVGPTGPQGAQGKQGIQGERGLQGEKGEKGEQGEKGDKGDKGDQGIQGVQGEKGETGATGQDGNDGVGIETIVIENGNLKITLTNETTLDLGNVKGEKGATGATGEKGEKGDKGESGNSGVYVGSGEMPVDCNVQIDPDGQAIDLQEEISKATKGLEERVEILEKSIEEVTEERVFELLNTCTIDSENTRVFVTRAQADGEPYKLDALMVKIVAPIGTSQAGYIYPQYGNDIKLCGCYLSNMVRTDSQTTTRAFTTSMYGYWHTYSLGSANGAGNNASVNNYPYQNLSFSLKDYPHITSVVCSAATAFPVGTVIEIWGVRANA